MVQNEKSGSVIRRGRFDKNSNPYHLNHIAKEPRFLKKSVHRASMVVKPVKKIKPEGKLKVRSHKKQHHSRYQIAMRKNSARLSEEASTHREKQSIEDYSKILKNLK